MLKFFIIAFIVLCLSFMAWLFNATLFEIKTYKKNATSKDLKFMSIFSIVFYPILFVLVGIMLGLVIKAVLT